MKAKCKASNLKIRIHIQQEQIAQTTKTSNHGKQQK